MPVWALGGLRREAAYASRFTWREISFNARVGFGWFETPQLLADVGHGRGHVSMPVWALGGLRRQQCRQVQR